MTDLLRALQAAILAAADTVVPYRDLWIMVCALVFIGALYLIAEAGRT